MADQHNQQFGGHVNPLGGGQAGGTPVPGGNTGGVQPVGGQPAIPVPPVPMPQPAAAPVPPMPVAPAPVVPQPVVPPVPMPTAPQPVAAPAPVVPPVPMPQSAPAPGPPPSPAPAAPPKPKKPMTLEDLAKQTPIFSDEELEEDDFDPWAPLEDSAPEEEEEPVKDEVKVTTTIKEDVSKKEEVVKEESVPEEPKKTEVQEEDELPLSEEETEPEVIEGSLVDEADVDPFEGLEPDEESPLKNFLKNANISPKKIVGCVVVFGLLILLIIGLIFGGKLLFNMLTNDSPKEHVEEVVEVEEVEKVEKEVVVKKEEVQESSAESLPVGFIHPSLYAGVKMGDDKAEGFVEVPHQPAGVFAPGNENIAQYVDILSRIRGVYETDIQAMLNASGDRNRTLNEFLSRMKSLSKEAHDSLPRIGARKSELQVEFDEVTRQKQIYEDAYFENLKANNPQETNDDLVQFTILAKDSVDIRARYRALDKVEEYMNRFVSALDTRIRDVEFNREALIKGVKVIDVQGSDIELIIPESDL